ncbi:MAG: DNA polymerase Y family protein [Verrucomicrobiales bacterium]|nr:DNA polymerase Y family protein [Verrucomicrobiales bacterium]
MSAAEAPHPAQFAAIYFPGFALQAVLRHEPESWARELALVDGAVGTPKVVEATASAKRSGVTLGLTAPQALARCAGIRIRHRSAEREIATMEALVQCAYGFTPHLEITGPGLLTLDLRGLSRLNPTGPEADSLASLRDWAEPLLSQIEALNLRGRMGIGPTPSVAQMAAQGTESGPGTKSISREVVLVEDALGFIRCLGVETLRPSSHVLELLRRWGVRKVGEMLDLGQAALAERLGLEALALFGAASVNATRPLRCVVPEERFEEGHEFEEPVETHEPLLFLLRRFTDSLGHRLGRAGWAAGVLRLTLRFESGTPSVRELRVPQPTHRSDVLFRMLHTHLETYRSETRLKGVVLVVEPARPEQKQFSLFEPALRDPHQFQETLARLSGLLGAERVGSPRRENSHRTDAFVLVPPNFENADPADLKEVPELLRSVPVRRFRPPLPAEVELSAQESGGVPRPLELRCSIAQGRLTVAVGPWKTSGGWWEGAGWEREEWDVSLGSGRVLRLVRVEGSWKVEAILD